MHPAYSVIVFTTASGAGYGLLFWLSLLAGMGRIPTASMLGLSGFALALGLITMGLLSSTLHLGRPERAWRALSQWRTSWLSREGVLALAAYVPTGLVALAWVLTGSIDGIMRPVALLTALLALATVWCTGMIYASLPTIRAWHHPLVSPIYVVLALATGGVLLNLVLVAHGIAIQLAPWIALVPLAIGWMLKAAYWSSIDGAQRTLTAGMATGLGRIGTVTPLDPPHTQANYVMREMGFSVARRHADKLRQLVVLALFIVPLTLMLALLRLEGVFAVLAVLLAVVSAGVGVLVERWLFFAEAEHVVTLYYGREAA